MQLRVGIYSPPGSFLSDGWKILCEQEKTPFTTVDCQDCPVVVWEGAPPVWLPEYLQNGGVAVATGLLPRTLPFDDGYVCEAALEYAHLTDDARAARVGCVSSIFSGTGLGELTLHEKRVAKNGMRPDVYPAFVHQSYGQGGCWYTGLPLSRLVTALGNTLRLTTDFDGFSERVVAVDKDLIFQAMRAMLIRAFHQKGYPYVHLHYYPGDYQSAFAFRVDVDGIYGDNMGLLSAAAVDCGMRLSFYVNKSLCEPQQERLSEIDPMHETGNHADVHNLYTGYEENLRNVTACKTWLDNMELRDEAGFVAPRGMWNFALAEALLDAGYTYSSDFGYCIFGFPLYPYRAGERLPLLQIPIDPFSTERAACQAREEGRAEPSAADVFAYFSRSMDAQYQAGQPVFLYSHPEVFGPMAAEVLPQIKGKVDGLSIWQTTLSDFARWWKRRDAMEFALRYDRASETLQIEGALDADMGIQIIKP
ncbi:MAG: hypothetical protein FWC72_02690 [Oscillospiraceae bacterium]|nr:hypothetical protein [Oscillospiraceae bacterium]